MAKASSLLAILCGLASLSASLADPSMYGAAPAAKYPAPATYPAPAATYPAPATTYPAPAAYPAPAKYETPAPTTTTPKYETPTTTAKYETPAKYEEKKEEYPMKKEYKKEEYPPSPMKMKYGGKKYRRSIEEDSEEAKTEKVAEDSEKTEDPAAAGKLPRKVVQTVRDAVIQDLMSMMDDDLDLEELKNFANDGEEETDEEMMNEDDQETLDAPMDDGTDSAQADPWMMKNFRFLLRKRIQAKTMCSRYPYKCAGRRRPWMVRPWTVKRRPSVYRPSVIRPMMTRFPSVRCGRCSGRCFWMRICC